MPEVGQALQKHMREIWITYISQIHQPGRATSASMVCSCEIALSALQCIDRVHMVPCVIENAVDPNR